MAIDHWFRFDSVTYPISSFGFGHHLAIGDTWNPLMKVPLSPLSKSSSYIAATVFYSVPPVHNGVSPQEEIQTSALTVTVLLLEFYLDFSVLAGLFDLFSRQKYGRTNEFVISVFHSVNPCIW